MTGKQFFINHITAPEKPQKTFLCPVQGHLPFFVVVYKYLCLRMMISDIIHLLSKRRVSPRGWMNYLTQENQLIRKYEKIGGDDSTESTISVWLREEVGMDGGSKWREDGPDYDLSLTSPECHEHNHKTALIMPQSLQKGKLHRKFIFIILQIYSAYIEHVPLMFPTECVCCGSLLAGCTLKINKKQNNCNSLGHRPL